MNLKTLRRFQNIKTAVDLLHPIETRKASGEEKNAFIFFDIPFPIYLLLFLH